MGARSKLNAAHLNGSLIFAIVALVLFGDFAIAVLVFVLSLVAALISGGIRLRPRK